MEKKIFLPLYLVFTLSSCHLYQPYERPDIPISDSLFRETASIADTSSIASLPWKELFTDSVLQQLIELGLKNNADLNIARSKVKEAEALLRSSKWALLPSVALSPQGTISKTGHQEAAKSYNLAVTSNWEVDIFGKLHNNKRGAAAQMELSQAYEQAVQTQLISTIANSYFTLLMLDKQADISQRTALSWKESVRVMRGLMRAGQATELSVNQTEANQFAVEASVVSMNQQIHEVENALSTLLGIPPQAISRTKLDKQVFPDTLTIGIPLRLLAHRPDIRQKEMELAKAFYASQTARAAFYPNVTLGGSAGWTNTATGAISNPGQWLLSAVGSIFQPLFNKGTNLANLKVTEARQEQSLLAFQQSLLDAGKEVNNALTQWQSARKKIQVHQQEIASLQSALHNAGMLMQYGSNNYLEILTAQQALLRAELDMVNDQFDEIQGVVYLYHALGGGK